MRDPFRVQKTRKDSIQINQFNNRTYFLLIITQEVAKRIPPIWQCFKPKVANLATFWRFWQLGQKWWAFAPINIRLFDTKVLFTREV